MQKLLIHSAPRSGSTWLGTIFDSHPKVSYKYQPLFSYAYKDYIQPDSSKEVIDAFFQSIAFSTDAFINQIDDKNNGIIPIFEKDEFVTHVCYKEVRYHHVLLNLLKQSPDVKAVFLIRHPLAVLYSWYKAPKEFRAEKGWLFEDEWLKAEKKNENRPEEFNGYIKWKEANHIFLKLKAMFPERVRIVSYASLIENPQSTVKMLFDFVNLSYDGQTEEFLIKSTTMHQQDAYSVFKEKRTDNDWKQLPKAMISYIYDDLKGTELEYYLT